MIDRYLRPVKDKLLLPGAKIIDKYFSPNQISIIAFVFGLLSCLMIILNHLQIALVFWLLNRITDGLDGTVSRISDRQTDWGGYLDIMLDFIIYALIPISLTVVSNEGILIYLSLSVMLSIFYINSASWMYLSAIQEKRTVKTNEKELTSVHMPTGLVEGAETIFLYTLFFFASEYLTLLFFTVSGLTLIGIIQRMIWAYKNLQIKYNPDENK
jgi:phosphatidylglycerophosphate synthase